jgi:hypothetical protein
MLIFKFEFNNLKLTSQENTNKIKRKKQCGMQTFIK